VAIEHLPLAQVAGLVGYTRQSSFSRWFADTFGASPTAWRMSKLDRS
jgi:AraC-like DNA-binding protein